jgi:hypothetical protein
MPRLLFKNFLDDPTVYRACERYWARLTSTIADSLGQSGQWPQWMPRTFADGKTPFPDFMKGNPIHDGRSEKLDRAFQIIQDPPRKRERGVLVAWLSICDLEYREVPRDELVISLTLTDQTAALARKLLRKWMTPETTAEEMKTFLDQNVPEPKPKRRRATRRSSSRS